MTPGFEPTIGPPHGRGQEEWWHDMVKQIRGKVRGRTIELSEDLGLQDGQEVRVHVTLMPPAATWSEGLRRCAGALADEWTEEDDRILEEIHQDRKRDTRPEIVE
jgi:hypothetical protein